MPAGRIWLACCGLRSAREGLAQIVGVVVGMVVGMVVGKFDCRGTAMNLQPASFALGWEFALVIGNSPEVVSCEWAGGKDGMHCPSRAWAGPAYVCT